MRHVAQNHAGAPAADQHVAVVGQFEDFLGRVACQALAADLQALEQRGAAFEKVMDGTLPHVQVLGDVMLDQMVENNRKPQPVGDALGDLPAAGTHLPRHRYDWHHVLLWFRRSAPIFAHAVYQALHRPAEASGRLVRSTHFTSSIASSNVDPTMVATSQSNADNAVVWNAACRNGT